MKQQFIKYEGNERLLLLFAGWGVDERLFCTPVAEGYDFLLCYDYRTLNFDFSFISKYKSIRLAAWSMGVWVAGKILANVCLPYEMKLAFNGTPFPIDDERGIPFSIFQGTLQNMSEAVLFKFRRRMCGTSDEMKCFMTNVPLRSWIEIGEELSALQQFVMEEDKAVSVSFWNKVYIGLKDRIFPIENQRKAWEQIVMLELDVAHYDSAWMASLLQGGEGIWTKP